MTCHFSATGVFPSTWRRTNVTSGWRNSAGKPGADFPESRFLAMHLQGRSSGRDHRRRLQVRAESQQTAIAVLHHELARVPRHVGNSPSEFYALGCVLGIKCIGIFDQQVRVEQFFPVFVRIGSGRLRAAEVNHLLVARHDGIDRRILPPPQEYCRLGPGCTRAERDLDTGSPGSRLACLPCRLGIDRPITGMPAIARKQASASTNSARRTPVAYRPHRSAWRPVRAAE